MASPKQIREIRYLSGTTFNKAYTAADNAAWAAGTATKLRATAYDGSGLDYAAQPDTTIQQRVYARPAPIPTIRRGSFTMSTYLGAGTATNASGTIATLLSKVLGGVTTPAARTDAADSSGTHNATRVYASGIEATAVVGTAVLLGTRGDGRGNGEVRSVVASGTDYIDLNMATSAAVQDDDAIVIANTVYPDFDSTQQYLDFLVLGHASNDQRQMLACQATNVALAGAAPGELPSLNWTFGVADWQWTDGSGVLSTTAASQGADPPVNLGLGGFFLQDNGTTTRTVFKAAEFAMPNLGVAYTEVPDYNGLNGIGAWQKVVPSDGITASVKLLHDEDMTGLYSDFTAGTAKQLIMQFGNTAQACVAIEFPRCYVMSDPKESDIGGLSAVELQLVANESSITTNDLTLAAFRIHYF